MGSLWYAGGGGGGEVVPAVLEMEEEGKFTGMVTPLSEPTVGAFLICHPQSAPALHAHTTSGTHPAPEQTLVHISRLRNHPRETIRGR